MVEKCFKDISELITKIKGEENLIVLGDWNVAVEGIKGNALSKITLGQRN